MHEGVAMDGLVFFKCSLGYEMCSAMSNTCHALLRK